MPTINKLDIIAAKVLSTLDRLLSDQKIIESMIETYIKICRSDNARRLNISETPITNELHLRLRFECLCFSVFLTILQSPKYFREYKWLVKRPNKKLIELFDGAIATALIELCNNTGMSELHEIIPVSIDPKIIFGFGDHLDPLKRLEDYHVAFTKLRGSEIEQFGKWIGKSLDAQHYPLLEIIGGQIGILFVKLSQFAMANTFMSA